MPGARFDPDGAQLGDSGAPFRLGRSIGNLRQHVKAIFCGLVSFLQVRELPGQRARFMVGSKLGMKRGQRGAAVREVKAAGRPFSLFGAHARLMNARFSRKYPSRQAL
ncbi:MAG: hypothetical protein HY699_11745 [Deltaproteobacteria bacterium]|nr:hypothetical protein [Deltaproteobacteria bacterium]